VSVPTLLVSGSCGVGKSTIAREIHDVLAEAEIANAAVDLDALTWQWPSGTPFNRDLKFENLAAMWPNYRAHGAIRLVLAGVLRDRRELALYEEAIPGAEIVVCRLVAPEPVRIERVCERLPPGPSRDWHVKRTVELEGILTRSKAEDFVVANDSPPPREVARDVLARIGWPQRSANWPGCVTGAGPIGCPRSRSQRHVRGRPRRG
jgi:adenylylsulfate kinase